MIKLVTRDDLPVASDSRPWSQVEWIFDQKAHLARSVHTKENYKNAKKHMIAFLRAAHPRDAQQAFDVNANFDEYILLKFKAYIDDQSMSSYQRVTVLSSARQAISTAVANKWIVLEGFIDFSLPSAVRETDARHPYSDSEMETISSALEVDLRFSRSLLEPYRRAGCGRPPLVSNGVTEKGWWRAKENIRWYFENVLNCQPITAIDTRAKDHKKFLVHATSSHKGLHELYRSWGVTAWIGPEVILPYVFKLVAETGLNPSVALSLRIQDFEEAHPLTGKAYIQYWKERGSGAGQLHPELLGDGSLGLSDQQCADVKKTWEEVQRLTSSFRSALPPERRDLLFVYQSRSVNFPGAARDFLTDAKTVGLWAREFVARHRINSRSGAPLEMTLSRFRPSLVSRLLRKGVDIYVIKAILGHGSILTTLRYIHSHDFMPHARREVHRALEQIRKNRQDQLANAFPQATQENIQSSGLVFSTPLALCKDVFNPPENIRKAAGIAIGKPCTIFNMCLRCSRVVIMEEHLPQLFALRREYVVALESGLSEAPHRHAIQQNIFVLNSLLDEDLSDWPIDVLDVASRKSELIATLIDTVACRGVGA